LADIAFIVTQDPARTIDETTRRHGTGPDRRQGVERVGGTLAGKTLTAPDLSECVIILDSGLVAHDGDAERVSAGFIVCHELGHAMSSCARRNEVPIAPDTDLPWEMAPLLGRIALEEYRADLFAYQLTSQALGFSAPKELFSGALYQPALESVLPDLVPGLPDEVWRYKEHRMSLEDMWSHVVRYTEGALILTAHAAAEADATEGISPLDHLEHPAVEFGLQPMWEPLVECFAGASLWPQKGTWSDAISTIDQAATPAILDWWGRLGLTFERLDEGFYIAVGVPACGD
jgi:hypothetical protein